MQSSSTTSSGMATSAALQGPNLSSSIEFPIMECSLKDSSIGELQKYLERTSQLFHNTNASVSREGELQDAMKDSGTHFMEIADAARQDAEIHQDMPEKVQLHFMRGQLAVFQRELSDCAMNISKLKLQMNLQISQGVARDNKQESSFKAFSKDVEDLQGLYKNEICAREVEFIAQKAKLIEIETQLNNERKEREGWEERYKSHMVEVREAVFSAFRQCLPAISRNLKDLKDSQEDSNFQARRSRESLNSRLLELERRCSSVEKRMLETLNIQAQQFETFKVEHKQADQKQMQDVDEKFSQPDSEDMSPGDELQESSPKKPCCALPVQVQIQEQTEVQEPYLSKDFGEESAKRLLEIEHQIAEFRKQDMAISQIIDQVGQTGGNLETTDSNSSNGSALSMEHKSRTLSETSTRAGSAISGSMLLLDSEIQLPLAPPMPVTRLTTPAPVATPTTSAPVATPTTSAPVATPTTPAPVTTPTTRAPATTSPFNLSSKGPKILSSSLCLPNSGDAESIVPDPHMNELSRSTPSIQTGRSTVPQTGRVVVCHQPLSPPTSVTTPRPKFSMPSPQKNPFGATASVESPSPRVIPVPPQSSPNAPFSMLSFSNLPNLPKMVWPLRTVDPVAQRVAAPEEQRVDRSRSQRRTFANYEMTQTSRQVTMAPSLQRPVDSSSELHYRPEQRTESNGNARPASRYTVL